MAERVEQEQEKKNFEDFNHVALEGWDKDSIEKYLKPYLDQNASNDAAIKDYIARRFGEQPNGFVDKMMDFIRALKSADIKSSNIIGLDPKEVKISPSSKIGDRDADGNERNESWANQIAEYSRANPDAKVMVVAGQHWISPPNPGSNQRDHMDSVATLLRKNK